jgi:hypothetical protein
MFIQNKYTAAYFRIIEKARSEARSKCDGYFERHHITPRSFGGTNKKDNLVLLKPREHFVCHLLLTKMVCANSPEWHKMLHSFMLMKGQNKFQDRYINNRLYDKLKEAYAEYRRSVTIGVPHTAEHRAKIAQAMTGRTMSEEAKKAISEKAAKRPRKPFSDEYRAKMSAIMKERRKTG